MIRALLAVFALGLLAYPVVSLMDIEDYRATLDDMQESLAATAAQLQTVAALHWLKNAYLAFAFLLLARYVGAPERPADLSKAGGLLMAFPVIDVLWQTLAQLAMSVDPEDLDINIQLRSDYLLYCMLGLGLIGITRAHGDNGKTTDAIARGESNDKGAQA